MSKPILSHTDCLAGILNHDISFLSKAITLVESSLHQDNLLAAQLLDVCLPYSGKSFRIGITGTPGVGKSTFIDGFGMYLIEQGLNVAVLAIDPSSSRSGGSILGDKTRMEGLSANPNAYIRPSPTKNTLGGVAKSTRESIILCETAGYQVIIVETVGVGQSETTVREMVDFFLLLLQPGAGDDLQGIKRGIVEMVDGIAINKADGNSLPYARKTQSDYQHSLQLFPNTPSHWKPQVYLCSALENKGFDAIWDTLNAYQLLTQQNNYWEINRQQQQLAWFHNALNEKLLTQFYQNPRFIERLKSIETDILSQKISPSTAILNTVSELFSP